MKDYGRALQLVTCFLRNVAIFGSREDWSNNNNVNDNNVNVEIDQEKEISLYRVY